jgi:hypothetical protein
MGDGDDVGVVTQVWKMDNEKVTRSMQLIVMQPNVAPLNA